jgi:hypothetical protein
MVAANFESPFTTLLKQHAVEVSAATELRGAPKRAMTGSGGAAAAAAVCSITGCGKPITAFTALCPAHTLSGSAQSAGTPRSRSRPSALVLDDSFMPALFGSLTPTTSPRNLLTLSPSLSPSAEVVPRASQPQRALSTKFKMRRCTTPGCIKLTQGNTPHCKAHGGGRRCQEVGCTRAARGNTNHCISHGGGRRCNEDGCIKSAVGATLQCVKHGGGRRCSFADCVKAARGGSPLCARHHTLELKRQGISTRTPSAASLVPGAERRASVDALVLQQQQQPPPPLPLQVAHAQHEQQQVSHALQQHQQQQHQQQQLLLQHQGHELEPAGLRRREHEGFFALNRPAFDRFGAQPVGFSPRHALLSPAPSPTNSSSMFASLAQSFFGDNAPYGAPAHTQAGSSAQHYGAANSQGRFSSAHHRVDVHEPLEYDPDHYHGQHCGLNAALYDEQQEHEHRRLLAQFFRTQQPHAHQQPHALLGKRERA